MASSRHRASCLGLRRVWVELVACVRVRCVCGRSIESNLFLDTLNRIEPVVPACVAQQLDASAHQASAAGCGRSKQPMPIQILPIDRCIGIKKLPQNQGMAAAIPCPLEPSASACMYG